jgi:hypothetical protein
MRSGMNRQTGCFLAALAAVSLSLVILAIPIGNPPVAAAIDSSRVYLPLVQMPSAWETILSDSFESDVLSNWVADYPNGASPVTWGTTQCRSYAGNSSAWIMGSIHPGCGSAYQSNMEAWMVYGPFSLRGAIAADVTFRYWINTESNVDKLAIGVSTDGYNFDGSSTSGSSNGWRQSTFDLNRPYGPAPNSAGSSSVWIAFVFSSDSANNAVEGAYVDDVLVRTCKKDNCPGSISTVSVSPAASALSEASQTGMSDWSGSLPKRGR